MSLRPSYAKPATSKTASKTASKACEPPSALLDGFFKLSIGNAILRHQEHGSTGAPLGQLQVSDREKRVILNRLNYRVLLEFYYNRNTSATVVLGRGIGNLGRPENAPVREFLKRYEFRYDPMATMSPDNRYLRWYRFPSSPQEAQLLNAFLNKLSAQQQPPPQPRPQPRPQPPQQPPPPPQQPAESDYELGRRILEAIDNGEAPSEEDVRKAKGIWGDNYSVSTVRRVVQDEMSRAPAISNATEEGLVDKALVPLRKRLSAIVGHAILKVNSVYQQKGKTYEDINVLVDASMTTPLGGAHLFVRTQSKSNGRKLWNFTFYPSGQPESKEYVNLIKSRMIDKRDYKQGQVRSNKTLVIALNALWLYHMENIPPDQQDEFKNKVTQAVVANVNFVARTAKWRRKRRVGQAGPSSSMDNEDSEYEEGEYEEGEYEEGEYEEIEYEEDGDDDDMDDFIVPDGAESDGDYVPSSEEEEEEVEGEPRRRRRKFVVYDTTDDED